MSIAFLWLFLVLMIIGIPVFLVLLMAPAASLFLDERMSLFPQLISRLFNGIFSFPLMAIPLFILAGDLMNSGGITSRLVNFSQALIGHIRGGLGQVNILSSILFAGLSGSAVADASALGSMLIPAMEKVGYQRRVAAAITAASAVIGPIIPPSIIMIIYAFIMQVSPAALFAAGLVPGLLIGAGLMATTALLAKRFKMPVAERKATTRERVTSFRAAFLPMMTPVILLGGIISGVFTPTEAAGVAVFWALLVSLFFTKTLHWRQLPNVCKRSAISAGAIMLVIGASVAFAWLAIVSSVPQSMSQFAFSLTENTVLLLITLNILLFVIGMFLDAGPAILILGPILEPLFVDQLGVDPAALRDYYVRQRHCRPDHTTDGAGIVRHCQCVARAG